MEVTLNRPDIFPAGTSVGIYDADDIFDPTVAPIVAPIQTKIVGDTGEVEEVDEVEVPVIDPKISAITFTGLSKRNYCAGAAVGGRWHFVRFVAGVLGSSLKPPARYPSHGI